MQHQTPEMPVQECLSLGKERKEVDEIRTQDLETTFNYNSVPNVLVLLVPYSFPAKEINALLHTEWSSWCPTTFCHHCVHGAQPWAGRYPRSLAS